MKQKIITFGEIMLRLAPEGYYRFVQADSFGATYGGGEANVAVSLANYGFDAGFVTKLPTHEIGQAAINSLRRYGVDTSHISRGGDRVGIY
ncbi:MAG: PfkB family carbohydrate kinase, partial [Lachnospiraceae bacterium]